MAALGSVDVISADTAFAGDSVRPTLPGFSQPLFEQAPRDTGRRRDNQILESLIESNLRSMLDVATRRVDIERSSTTLASLALAYESTGDQTSAVDAAREALRLCAADAIRDGALIDSASCRLALEVLLRGDQVDEAIEVANSLPLQGTTRLMIGATLASLGRIEEARALVDDTDAPQRDAVQGFLLMAEGKTQAAISHLRAALKEFPDDADSALNLSIAFLRSGALSKATAAALQATRSAPGREDASLHYLDLLLERRDFAQVKRELEQLRRRQVVPSARLLIVEARTQLAEGDATAGVKSLERASVAARAEGNFEVLAEVSSNLIRIKAFLGKADRQDALKQLLALHQAHPESGVTVVNLAQVADRRAEAEALSDAFNRARDSMQPSQAAFVEYQIATLMGNNPAAADAAAEWLRLEPNDPAASVAAMVALGIGDERWAEAAKVARSVIEKYPGDTVQINNAAYILAMSGSPGEAIELLAPYAENDFVLRATLGLAYLASNRLAEGMRLYRQAAEAAEKRQDAYRSLMATYQALVVRQLGLLDRSDVAAVAAVSLAPVPLPDDWEDRPEFLRLRYLATKKRYSWPLDL